MEVFGVHLFLQGLTQIYADLQSKAYAWAVGHATQQMDWFCAAPAVWMPDAWIPRNCWARAWSVCSTLRVDTTYPFIHPATLLSANKCSAVMSWLYWLAYWALICVVTMTVIGFVSVKVYEWWIIPSWLRKWRYLFSWLFFAGKPHSVRDQFSAIHFPPPQERPDHSHGYTADARARVSKIIDTMAAMSGLTPYYVQYSRRDQALERSGSRSYYELKDTSVEPSEWSPPPNPLFVLIDVDYYLDMEYELAYTFAGYPVILYTMVPKIAAGCDGDVKWTWTVDGKMLTIVKGSGRFHHELWDYGKDNIAASYGFRYAGYLVDRRCYAHCHQLILFTPLLALKGLKALFAKCVLNAHRLTKLNPVQLTDDETQTGFIRLRVFTDSVLVSTGRVGEFSAVTVTEGTDSAIRSSALNSGHKLTLGTTSDFVKSDAMMVGQPSHIVRTAASIIQDYYLKVPATRVDAKVFPVEFASRKFDATYVDSPPTLGDPGAMDAYSTPIVNMGHNPVISKNNERRAIEGRILASRGEDTPFPAEDQWILDGFLRRMIPDDVAQTFSPVEVTEVAERQSAPRQASNLFKGMTYVKDLITTVRMFLKKEPYQKKTDGRVILQVDPVFKMKASRYQYAVSEHLKRLPWYMPGRTPKEVAHYVARLCSDAAIVFDNDAHRMDGHVRQQLRHVTNAMLFRMFKPEFHDEIRKMNDESANLLCYTVFGLKYKTGEEQLSGHPDTINVQTVRTIYMIYCALVKCKLSLDDAWAVIMTSVAAQGDDSFVALPTGYQQIFDSYANTLVKVNSKYGQSLEVVTTKRGEPGVQFLARYYSPAVWTGDVNSICDIKRTLAKLHLAVKGQWGKLEKCAEKALAYYLTDSNTPVVGAWCKAVRRVIPENLWPEKFSEDVSYSVRNAPESELWPNEVGDWALDVLHKQFDNCFDYDTFIEWAQNATLNDILSPPCCYDPEVPEVEGIVEINAPTGHTAPPRVPDPEVTDVEDDGSRTQNTKQEEAKAIPPKEKEEEIQELKTETGTSNNLSDIHMDINSLFDCDNAAKMLVRPPAVPKRFWSALSGPERVAFARHWASADDTMRQLVVNGISARLNVQSTAPAASNSAPPGPGPVGVGASEPEVHVKKTGKNKKKNKSAGSAAPKK